MNGWVPCVILSLMMLFQFAMIVYRDICFIMVPNYMIKIFVCLALQNAPLNEIDTTARMTA
jgi:hypothetical protein